MRKYAIAVVSLFLFGCATTGMHTRNGSAIYTDFKEGLTATNESGGSKTGEACASNILGIVSLGDASIEAAKKAGGISKVSSVDYSIMNVLMIYGKSCTIVKGN